MNYLRVKEDFELETKKGFQPFVAGQLLTFAEFGKYNWPKPIEGVIQRRFDYVVTSVKNTRKATLANIRFLKDC